MNRNPKSHYVKYHHLIGGLLGGNLFYFISGECVKANV